MPTIREYLGDEKIAKLENMGFLPSVVTELAKSQYYKEKQERRNELSNAGLSGDLVQKVMRGEIDEKTAFGAQKFQDIGSKTHGWALEGLQWPMGIANAAERVSDIINPFYEGKRDEKGEYIYQNAIEKKFRGRAEKLKSLRDDWERATGKTAWGSRVTEGAFEIVADPINFVGGMGLLAKGEKLYQFAKKSLYFSATGAASVGITSLGEGHSDKETATHMMIGAGAGLMLGHAVDQAIIKIQKLLAKRGVKVDESVASDEDFIKKAEESEFLGGGKSGELKVAETMTAREFATQEVGLDEVTAAKVMKEAAHGKEKSDFVNEDTYADIIAFRNFENQRDYAKAYGERIEAAQASLERAREQSAVRYAETQKAINEYQKQGMSASATRELIGAKFKPGADEINYTRAYNGSDVDPRLAGQGIFYALEKDIAAQAYTPEIYAARLKQRGFSDESAQAFTQAYANKDINIAKHYANGKAAEVYEEQIRKRVAAEIKAKNEIEGEGWTIKDGGAVKPEIYEGDGIIDFSSKIDDDFLRANATELEPSSNLFDFLAKTKNNPSRDKILNHFADKAGEGDSKVLDHRMAHLNYIMPTIEEPLIKIFRPDGRISNIKPFVFTDVNSKTKNVNFLSIVTDKDGNIDFITAYALKDKSQLRSEIKKGIKVEVRRGFARTFDPHSRVQVPSATERIISQKGNLVNEAETNGLSDSVSSIGDNASRASGRQAGDAQIPQNGRPDTSNAGEAKRRAQSDRQMEQRSAAKTDGEANAAAASEQMVEKQIIDSLEREYDVERFLRDRENISAKDAKYGSKIAQKSDLVTRWNKDGRYYEYVPPLKEKNYNADFLTTKADVAKIRGGKADKATIEKLRSDLQNSEHMGYDYKTTDSELRGVYKDESIDWSKKPQGMKDDEYINDLIAKGKAPILFSNPHLGSGLVAGTLNSVDENGNFSPERFAAGFLAGLAGGKAVATGLRKMTPKLYNKILGIAEKMPQMANGNPRLLGKLYSNGKDVSLNSFAGEKAITANIGKLDQAKAMLEKGADEVEIWQKTGWFKDEIDGKWKFEINPRGGKLKPNPPSNTVLYNVLNDEKLYEAYPQLQLYKVEIAGEYNPAALKTIGSANGGFIPSQKTFIINENATDFKSTLYHEIQHAIQEIEGFSAGASGKDSKYWLAGGEAEARNVQQRMSDVSYEGFKSSTSKEFFPYKEEAQLQRMSGDKEYMEYHKLSQKYSDYLNGIGDSLSAKEEARAMELLKKLKGRLGFTEDDYKNGYELYLKENAQYHKHPLHTLDVVRDKRVNIGSDDLTLSKELEKKYILKDGSINEAAIRKEAEPFIEKEYSLENFKAEFPNGKVDTPIGEVNISSFQLKKLELKGREKYLGLIKPTLERPAFVVDFEDTTFFFKPFRDKDGVVKFASVIKERDGGLDVTSNYPMANRKFELIAREGKVRYVQGSVAKPVEHSLDDTVRSSGDIKSLEHSSNGKGIIQQNEEKIHHGRRMEEIKSKHPNVERELDESIAAMKKESFNDSNFKTQLLNKFGSKEITTQELGKSVNLSDKQLAVLKNDIKNADFKVINESKIYFDKMGKDGDKKRFFVDIAEDGSLRVDAYAKSQIDNIPVKQSALEELAGTGDAARLKNMSFEVKAAYRNELDPIKKEAILKTAEYNALKKEMRGIYNVINNSKESTNVYKDLQKIDDAIKLERGSNKKGGGVHIQKHLDPNSEGAVTQQEVINIGEGVREYLKKYKEPFIDKDGGKIYEWRNQDGVRFRVAIYDKAKKSVGAGSTTRITTTDAYESIITFYSDRNLNGRMKFLDPRVRAEAKIEEFKAKNLDEDGNIKDGLELC